MPNTHAETYPYLAHLLGAYFHQDCYDDGETDAEIIADFIASTWPYQRLGTRADIERLLHQHADDLLVTINTLFKPDIEMPSPHEATADWLRAVAAKLAAAS